MRRTMFIFHAAYMQGESIYLKSRYCMQWHLQIMVSLHKRSLMLTLGRSSQHSNAWWQGAECRLSLRLFTISTSTDFCRCASVLCEIYHNRGCPARKLFLEASYRSSRKHQSLSHFLWKWLQHKPQDLTCCKVAAKRQTGSTMQQQQSQHSKCVYHGTDMHTTSLHHSYCLALCSKITCMDMELMYQRLP